MSGKAKLNREPQATSSKLLRVDSDMTKSFAGCYRTFAFTVEEAGGLLIRAEPNTPFRVRSERLGCLDGKEACAIVSTIPQRITNDVSPVPGCSMKNMSNTMSLFASEQPPMKRQYLDGDK